MDDKEIAELRKQIRQEVIDELINTPQALDFLNDVKHEMAHQHIRWGDEQVYPFHFQTVISYLNGKLIKSIWDKDKDKFIHHLNTIAAVAGTARKYLDVKNSMSELWFRYK